ncbi:tetratricopeptide repeat protein [Candidatus Sumerlaeota bacterium]|nr:tetratricopeptide repeat protein [Candidatus Sumerlaeota bacterium]
MRKFLESSFAPGIFFLLIAALYAPAMRNDFIYDDFEVILNHPAPRSWRDIAQLFNERHFPHLPYYRPITRTTLFLQKAIHGDHPAPFHFVNGAMMGLAFLVAFGLLRSPAFQIDREWAMPAAALFAAHPIASSCVYPISSGRETIMPALWMMGAVYAHLRAGARWRIAAGFLFIGSLLSKEQAVVLPAVFFAADALGLSAPEWNRRDWRGWVARYLPLLPILGVYYIVRNRLFHGYEFEHGVIYGPVLSAIFGLQAIIAPPVQLVYEPPLGLWLSLPRLAAVCAVIALLGALAVKLHPSWRLLLFWAGWFVIVMLPTSNLLKQEAAYDERYIFLSSLAFYAAAAMLGTAARGRARTQKWMKAVFGAAILISAGISLHRATYFKNDSVFLGHWLDVDPKSVNANLGIGQIRLSQNKPGEALKYYEAALEGDPKNPVILNGIGTIHAMRGEMDIALGFYQKAAAGTPGYAQSYIGIGNVYAGQGKTAEAAEQYALALKYQPADAETQFNLGAALKKLGRSAGALPHFKEAARLKPDNVEAHFQLALCLEETGNRDGAAAEYLAVVNLKPDYADAHINLGNILADKGELDAALAHLTQALKLKPDNADAQNNAGTILAQMGKLHEAIARFEEALRLRPDYANAHINLGQALMDSGRREEAIHHFRRAIDLDPSKSMKLNLN